MQRANQSVTLIDVMGNDLSIVNAARVSFEKFHEVYEEGKDDKLISYLANHGHWTPFAHNAISLRVKAPIFVARQLVKHQVGGVWNEVSRRYVDSDPEFYFPDVWRSKPVNAKQGSGEEVIDTIKHPDYSVQVPVGSIVEEQARMQLELYREMIKAGVAPEQARMVLPIHTMTEWIWTGSLMFFARVYKQRIDPHAQEEAQEIAKMINKIIEPLFPNGWKALTQ